jgi:excisionase family DNA binding protein
MNTTPMTTSTVARTLQRSEDTVRRYLSEGRLRGTRTDSGIRLYDAASVEALARELEQERRAR